MMTATGSATKSVMLTAGMLQRDGFGTLPGMAGASLAAVDDPGEGAACPGLIVAIGRPQLGHAVAKVETVALQSGQVVSAMG